MRRGPRPDRPFRKAPARVSLVTLSTLLALSLATPTALEAQGKTGPSRSDATNAEARAPWLQHIRQLVGRRLERSGVLRTSWRDATTRRIADRVLGRLPGRPREAKRQRDDGSGRGGEEGRELTLRTARTKDLDRVVEITESSFSNAWSRGSFERHLDNSGFLVAAKDGSVAGYVVTDVYRAENQDTGGQGSAVAERGRIGHVKLIAVSPNFRGQGVGGKLLERALSKLESRGVDRIKLAVRKSNEARRLYERKGFEVHHLEPDYYRDGEGAYVMVREP